MNYVVWLVTAIHLLCVVLWVGGMAFLLLTLRPSVNSIDASARLVLQGGATGSEQHRTAQQRETEGVPPGADSDGRSRRSEERDEHHEESIDADQHGDPLALGVAESGGDAVEDEGHPERVDDREQRGKRQQERCVGGRQRAPPVREHALCP